MVMDLEEKTGVRLVGDRGGEPLITPDSESEYGHSWLMVRHTHVWRPPTDVLEFSDRLLVRIEVAGMRDGSFNVALHDRKLYISGTRPRAEHERSAQQYHRMEIAYGEFRVEVSLPWPISREQATATYRDGFLHVELPRARNQQLYVVDVELDSNQDTLNPQETE